MKRVMLALIFGGTAFIAQAAVVDLEQIATENKLDLTRLSFDERESAQEYITAFGPFHETVIEATREFGNRHRKGMEALAKLISQVKPVKGFDILFNIAPHFAEDDELASDVEGVEQAEQVE